MRLLVCIASYGTRNDKYLKVLIDQYQAMPYDVDIIVLSNIKKYVGEGVKLLVGLPNKNPWSLPFGHKKIFAECINDYDLFIYSEDDTPISERNIEAFLKVTRILSENELAGFLRSEISSEGIRYFCDVHGSFHWDPMSVKRRGNSVFAYFTNEHSACYLLTQKQLRKAINSGGFLVAAHEGPYDLLCTAATDPYTQCGFKKMICISHMEDFIVPHLSSKYAGKIGVTNNDFFRQVEVLLSIERGEFEPTSLCKTQTNIYNFIYSKNYYEPINEDIISLIPDSVRNVLSIGCGWGAMEERLVQNGLRVVAVPLDPVIGSCAKEKGVEIVYGDFENAQETLKSQRFECLFISNIFHLLLNPHIVLEQYSKLLSYDSVVIIVVPNIISASVLLRRFKRYLSLKYKFSDVNNEVLYTSHKFLKNIIKHSGMRIIYIKDIVSGKNIKINRLTLRMASRWLADEYIAVASFK